MSDTINSYSAEEREKALVRMKAASAAYYADAVRTGCHAMVEFTGLMNEFIQICERSHRAGIDFMLANTHTGQKLDIQPHNVAYINEKLECIFQGLVFGQKAG